MASITTRVVERLFTCDSFRKRVGNSRAPQFSGRLLSQPYPAGPTPSAPPAPVHRCILVHLRGFKIFVSQFIRQTKLLVSLILCWTTNVSLVVSCVRQNVIGL